MTTDDSAPRRQTRRWTAARFGYLLLGLVAHAFVGGAWLVTALGVMGSLGVVRRIPMNSEFAWDTGRLPQPWVIPIGLVLAWLAHRMFVWSMTRFGRGRLPYGPAVFAWGGLLLGVLVGAYLWVPPLQTGVRVGPRSGEFARWDTLAWVVYYARLWLPGLVALATLIVAFFSRRSPLVALVRPLRRPRRVRAA